MLTHEVLIATVSGALAPGGIRADMVHADPPWTYSSKGQNGAVAKAYTTMGMGDIVRDLNAAYEAARPDSYLLLWCTYPLLMEWRDASRESLKWRYVSGGCWAKSNGIGVGFHWRGDSEPVLLYAKGKPHPQHHALRNTHVGPRGRHSAKPVAWQARLVAGLCAPGGTVLDLYAGTGTMGVACIQAQRSYVGIEADFDRAQAAQILLLDASLI